MSRNAWAWIVGLAILGVLISAVPRAAHTWYLHAFQDAAERGDVVEMESAFSGLLRFKSVRRGMLSPQVIAILGNPRTSTGIFIPSGNSLGYGRVDSADEYRHIFWLHFAPQHPKTDSLALTAWGEL